MKLLNLGCGSSFHPKWTNVDFVSTGPGVIACNLLTGIPFPDNSFDAVYNSHVLEHFSKSDAQEFISECHRVLLPGGKLRVAVPDLEGIAKCYLEQLRNCLEGNVDAEENYNWILLELFDQAVRRESGGEMGRYLSQCNNKEFITARIGDEATAFWRQKTSPITKMEKLKRVGLLGMIQKLRLHLASVAVGVIGGRTLLKSFKEGIFINSGEIHQWMYDRYSLSKLLRDSGLTDVRMCAANESEIEGFDTFGLELVNGKVRKPDSLFIEATKP